MISGYLQRCNIKFREVFLNENYFGNYFRNYCIVSNTCTNCKPYTRPNCNRCRKLGGAEMNKTFKVLAFLAYGISAISTGVFLVSMGSTFVERCMGLLITALFEPGKCVSFISIFKPCKNPIIKVATIVLWVVLEVGSVTASTAYMMNIDMKQQEKSTMNSTAYKEVEAKKENISGLIQSKKDEVTKLQQDKESTIAKMEADKEALPKNYLSAKAELQLKINQTSSTLQENIDKVNEDILTLTNDLNNTSVTSVKAEPNNGYTRIFTVIAGAISSSEEPVKAEHISLIFSFLIFGILPELMANIFYWYSKNHIEEPATTKVEGIKKFRIKPAGQDPVKDSPTSQKNRISKWLQSMTPLNGKKQIGFHQEKDQNHLAKSDFTDDDLRIYIEYMLKNQKDDVSPGYLKIADETGLQRETARKIKGYLERTGTVKTEGSQTKILKS